MGWVGPARARPAMAAGLRLLGLPMAALAARGLVLLLLCATPSSTIEFLSMYSENDAGLSLTPPNAGFLDLCGVFSVASAGRVFGKFGR